MRGWLTATKSPLPSKFPSMKTLRLIFALALAPMVAIAQNVNVQKSAATNAITANLNFPDARTLTFGTTTPGSITGLLGALTLTAAGTDQNIVLTPSGTGVAYVSGSMRVKGTATSGSELYLGADGTGSYIEALNSRPLDLWTGGSVKVRITSGGIGLWGTTTNSSNGRIQLAAGAADITSGIGYSTDVATYRNGAGAWTMEGNASPTMRVRTVGGRNLEISLSDAGNTAQIVDSGFGGSATFTVGTGAAGRSLVLASGATVTALTLDSSQRTIPASTIRLKGFTVATLPGSPSAGDTAHVTDSVATLTAGVGTTVVGGGANIVPVFYNGTNWLIY